MRFGRIAGTLIAFLSISWLQPGAVDGRPVILRADPSSNHRLPIIFVPGKGGSQIEAEVDRTGLPDQGLPECPKQLDRYRMWMDLWTFFKR